MPRQESMLERVMACLWGQAVGDAMGKSTEGYSPERIREVYGKPVKGFLQPVQPLSQFSWAKGEITEDTRQTLAVAAAILEKGEVDQLTVARHLLHCDPKGVGPSSRLFHFILSKDIGHVARKGSGNGAATRMIPVGLVNSSADLQKMLDNVVKATVMTHGGKAAISGAAAMAAATAAAIEGWPAGYVLIQALQAAKMAGDMGHRDNLVPVADKLQLGIDLASKLSGDELWQRIGEEIGWGFFANEAVPAAILLACTMLDAKQVILYAVNQGGDADAVAGMAGALAAALNPSTLPAKWIEEVRKANNLDMDELALSLVQLRPENKTVSTGKPAEIGG